MVTLILNYLTPLAESQLGDINIKELDGFNLKLEMHCRFVMSTTIYHAYGKLRAQ